MKNFIFKISLKLKRLIFFIKSLKDYIYNSFLWLFFSKEHTSFSIMLSKDSENFLARSISNFTNLSYEEIKKIIYDCNDIEIPKQKRSIEFSDVDFATKWDYRILSIVLIKAYDITNVYELGFNQGRTAYLINEYFAQNSNVEIFYEGIDINKRKGAFFNYIKNNNFKNQFIDLENYLNSFKNLDKLNNSLIISTTHENKSEKALFDFFEINGIYPKLIISDKAGTDSDYFKFVNKNDYFIDVYPFIDKNNFIKPNFISIAVNLTKSTS
tara:strand:+ start:17583 stop:18389 length:807 start_codon:yes stop_codon:yes gene_type:complete